MSIWNCTTHGRTGPIACCGAAVRESSTAAETPVVAVTAPTPDAVAQARYAMAKQLRGCPCRVEGYSCVKCDAAIDRLGAAVRAECAAKVDAQADALDADIGNESAVRILRKLARTLEAQP